MEAWARWAAPKASRTKTSARGSQGGDELRVVGYLAGVEAEVFQQDHLAGEHFRHVACYVGADAVPQGVDGAAQEGGEAEGHGLQAQRFDDAAPGAAQVGAEDNFAVALKKIFDGG